MLIQEALRKYRTCEHDKSGGNYAACSDCSFSAVCVAFDKIFEALCEYEG